MSIFLKAPPFDQILNYKILLKIIIFLNFSKSAIWWSKFELWNLVKICISVNFLKAPPFGQILNYKILLKISIFLNFSKCAIWWSNFELWNLVQNLHFCQFLSKAPSIGQNLNYKILLKILKILNFWHLSCFSSKNPIFPFFD